MHSRDADAAESIVQLGCNPTHVFHQECIESFVFCPECYVPIEKDLPHSFLDERSVVGGGSDAEDSYEENGHLLRDDRQAAAADQEQF